VSDLRKRLAWDDFRLVKAIADARGMPGAAAALGLDQSTVFRRLGQVEAALGTPLFERHRSGYGLTPAGEEMTAIAGDLDDRIAGFAQKVSDRALKPSGELRVATNDSLLVGLLTPLFAGFRDACPDVRLDVVVGNPALNLSKRDADVAVRATDSPPENLVGRRIARIAWTLYGRASDFPDPAAMPGPEALPGLDWVSLGDDFSALEVVRFVRAMVPAARLRYRVNTVLGLAEAVEAGLGVGHLPCFVGDPRPGLVRLAAIEPAFAADLWLLTHPDLRHSPRVRAFLDFMGGALAAARPLLEGATRLGPAPPGAPGG